MSTRVLNWVFTHSPTTGNDRLVLFAIADEADDDGTNAYPSVDRIASKARINKRTTLRCLSRLEEMGALIVHRPEKRGRGYFNTYVVIMDAPKKGDTLTEEKARNGDSGGTEKARNGDTLGALDPVDPGAKAPDPTPSAPQAAPTPGRGSRLPDPFLVTAAMWEWAAEEGIPIDVARRETTKFCDHWRAQPGARGRKLDWVATWRNWLRNASDRGGRNGSGQARRPTRAENSQAAIDRVLGGNGSQQALEVASREH